MGDDNEVLMTRSLNVTPKTTEQHLIVRSRKTEAEVTIIKDCGGGITLLKLSTDGNETSRRVLVILYSRTHIVLMAIFRLAWVSALKFPLVESNPYRPDNFTNAQ